LGEGFILIYSSVQLQLCNHIDQSVEALGYKPEGRGYNFDYVTWIFH